MLHNDPSSVTNQLLINFLKAVYKAIIKVLAFSNSCFLKRKTLIAIVSNCSEKKEEMREIWENNVKILNNILDCEYSAYLLLTNSPLELSTCISGGRDDFIREV
jgi:hypothetical protein